MGNTGANLNRNPNVGSTVALLARGAAGALLAALLAAAAQAQPPGDSSLEVTIRLLPENAVDPAEITRRIELPPAVRPEPSPDGAEGARPGAEQDRDDTRPEGPRERPELGGGEARDQLRDEGRGVGSEARERGREAAEQARENRENAARSDDARPRGRPDDAGPPGDPPGRPDDAGPPAGPPGNQ
jgi:hypothetical protein